MAKVLILGASSAIAIEAAKIWAQRGDDLFLVARNPEKLKSVSQDLEARGGKICGVLALDLNQVQEHSSLIQKASKSLNGIDICLMAHGTLGDQKASEQSVDLSLQEIHTNFVSPVAFLTLLANRMEQDKKGTIVVITSVAGDRGRQSNYVYGASKGGLSLFLQGLRNRLFASGVHVVTIKPGFVDTPMTAAFKKNILFAKPNRIAKGIVRAVETKNDVVYLPWFWWGIMTIIKIIPERIFKKMKL